MSEAGPAESGPLEPEDQARADFYALLARLYAAAPDARLLAAIAGAGPLDADAGGEDANGIAVAWDSLRAASADADPVAIAEEYQALFIGVGKSEVSLYASHYLGPQSGRPLAELRATLARLGLARRPEQSEFEDHLSVVLETMRMLVAGDGDRPPMPIADQRAFCERHLLPWVFNCCSAITQNSIAKFYRRVASYTSVFMALERDSFAIE
jgi:TorA maturation chaperone TorD